MPISAEFPFEKRRVDVLGKTMAYVAPLEYCRAWPNQHEITVPGNHFVQEDSPDEIGRAIAAWIRERVTP